jgi:hypothetical protein
MAMEAMKTGRFAATGMTALSWDRGVPDPVSGTLEHLSPMSLAISAITCATTLPSTAALSRCSTMGCRPTKVAKNLRTNIAVAASVCALPPILAP